MFHGILPSIYPFKVTIFLKFGKFNMSFNIAIYIKNKQIIFVTMKAEWKINRDINAEEEK